MAPELLYGLVLAAAVGHALWNVLLKAASDRLLMLAAIRAVGLVFGVALLFFVGPFGLARAGVLAAAVLAHFIYYALLLRSYQVGDLSLVHPIARGLAPVLVAGIAFAVLGEQLGPGQIVAVALASAGVLALATGRGASVSAVALAMATSIAIVGYTFLGGVGVRAVGSVLAFQAWLEILTGIGVVGFAAARRRGRVLAFARASGLVGLGAGVVAVGGYCAYLFAVAVLPMAPVAALRESSVLWSAVLGALALKEPFGRQRVLAALLVTAGIALLVAWD